MKERTTICIELEYEPSNCATIDQLIAALKEGIHVDFNTDHCKIHDVHYGNNMLICSECGDWVMKRPGGDPAMGIDHKNTCSYYTDGIYDD